MNNITENHYLYIDNEIAKCDMRDDLEDGICREGNCKTCYFLLKVHKRIKKQKGLNKNNGKK